MDKCEELVPDYFNFMRGVVDSADLTLNISRETLQQNSQLRAIARRLEKKIKSELESMLTDDRSAYENFFKEFGRTMKYGLYASYGMAKETLQDLLLFYSAKQKKMITLAEYVAASPADQGVIYFAAGESVGRLEQMPIVTTVLNKGHDVLLCTENVDEFCLMAMDGYAVPDADGKEGAFTDWALKNVSSEDLGLTTEEERQEAEEQTEKNSDLLDAMREALDSRVEKVVISSRLTDAPAMLTTEGPVTLQMLQMLKHQPGGAEDLPDVHVVMEINPNHPVFDVLKKAKKKGDSDKVNTYASMLYDQALLVQGLPIDDPLAFTQAITALMK